MSARAWNAALPTSRADVVTAAAVILLTVAAILLGVRDGTAAWQVLRGACVVALGTALSPCPNHSDVRVPAAPMSGDVLRRMLSA